MVGTTCRISSRNIRYSAEHSEFHFNIWLFGYAAVISQIHITNPHIYIYIYRAYYKLDSQLFNSCQIIYKPLYVLGSKHGFTWFLAIPCLLGILIPIPKLWVNQLIQSKLNDHIWPSQPPPWKIKRGWKITERDGWILQPLQPRGWWHQCRSMSIPWLTQTTMIDDQNHITNHDSKPWLSHIPTIKLLSLLLSL